jgi:molecular chaperone DnaK
MNRSKIDYGIDLGTTNSSIVTDAKWELRVFKIDVQMDIMPSCVGFNRKGLSACWIIRGHNSH